VRYAPRPAWETSEYWTRRAKGALRNAKYKERADVRHRRIKGLETDRRKYQKEIDTAQTMSKLWGKEDLTLEQARTIAGYDRVYLKEEGQAHSVSLYEILRAEAPDLAQVRQKVLDAHARTIASYGRWLAHIDNRLAYERAMLGEQGGLTADRFDIQPGGQVLIDGEWLTVKRVNKAGDRINSVSTSARFVPVRGIEEVKDYRAPSAEQAASAKDAAKLPKLCNYPGEGFLHMTKAEWDATHSDYKGSRELGQGAKRPGGYRPDLKNATEAAAHYGRHRVRIVVRAGSLVAVYMTDSKRVDPPAAVAAEPEQGELLQNVPPPSAPVVPCGHQTTAGTCSEPNTEGQQAIDCAACDTGTQENLPAEADTKKNRAEALQAMREQLRAGVQVVSAPQLFPTPHGLAARMVELAGIETGHSVLEPSAGTGNILRAIREATGGSAARTAIEINSGLCERLRITEEGAHVINWDFLQFDAPASKYDRVVMNPPFVNADDIKHIRHALGMIKPGGRLVAICANGPRQQENLRPLVEAHGGIWEELPEDAFEESGTRVRTVLLTIGL
jgi:phospholipid N-methyltransferase